MYPWKIDCRLKNIYFNKYKLNRIIFNEKDRFHSIKNRLLKKITNTKFSSFRKFIIFH